MASLMPDPESVRTLSTSAPSGRLPTTTTGAGVVVSERSRSTVLTPGEQIRPGVRVVRAEVLEVAASA